MTTIAWLDRDNTIDIALYDDGVLINHALVTRILLVFDTVTIDSNTSPAMFELSGSDKIVFKPATSTLSEGTYEVRVVTYDIVNTNGIVWGDERITVMQG
jgi:hypothetical protein